MDGTRSTNLGVFPVVSVFAALVMTLTIGVGGVMPDEEPRPRVQSISVSVEGASALRVVVPKRHFATVTGASVNVDLPIGEPTLLAAYSQDGTALKALAFTTADGNPVTLNARSTAAALVALSPVVIASNNWIGVTGHVVALASFQLLVDAIERSSSLADPEIRQELAALMNQLAVPSAPTCERVCAERTEEGRSIVVNNATVSRLVSNSAGGELCMVVAPAALVPSSSATSYAVEVLRGSRTGTNEIGPLSITPATALSNNPTACAADQIIAAGGADSETGRRALRTSLAFDFWRPLIDQIDSDFTLTDERADALASQMGASTETRAALSSVGVPDQSADFATTIAQIVAPGLLSPTWLPNVELQLAARPLTPAGEPAQPSTPTTVGVLPTVAPTVAPRPSTTRAPSTTTVTSIIRLVTKITLNVEAAGPPEGGGGWELVPEMRNDGETTLNPQLLACVLSDAGGWKGAVSMSMGSTTALRPGESAVGKIAVQLPRYARSPFTLECSHPSLDAPITMVVA